MSNPIVVPLENIFKREDGTLRPRDEAVKLFGHRSVWVAELRGAVNHKLSLGKPLSYPQRIFISYRWAGCDVHEWVSSVVQDFWSMGYIVFHDRAISQSPNPPDVPALVAMIANCHIYLAIVDKGFVERVGTEPTGKTQEVVDGWVWDEYQTAASLSWSGRLKVVGILREDCNLPRGFDMSSNRAAGNVLDCRDHASISTTLRQAFNYDAPLIVPFDVAGFVHHHEISRDALKANRPDIARASARQIIATAPMIPDGYFDMAMAEMHEDNIDDALNSFQKTIEVCPRLSEGYSYASLCAYRTGQTKKSAEYAVSAIDADPEDALAHYYLGNALDDKVGWGLGKETVAGDP